MMGSVCVKMDAEEIVCGVDVQTENMFSRLDPTVNAITASLGCSVPTSTRMARIAMGFQLLNN